MLSDAELNNMTVAQLRAFVKVLYVLTEDRDHLLAACPPCPLHGPCVPYALEWIGQQQASADALRTRLARYEGPGRAALIFVESPDAGITCARCQRTQQPPGNGYQPAAQQLCAACAVELGAPVMQQVLGTLARGGIVPAQEPEAAAPPVC